MKTLIFYKNNTFRNRKATFLTFFYSFQKEYYRPVSFAELLKKDFASHLLRGLT
jgi:hypothetical protein